MACTPRKKRRKSVEAQEDAVLSWLLEKSEVSEAVDLSLAGSDLEAGRLLVSAIRNILGKTDEASRGKGVEASGLQPRRKRSASRPPVAIEEEEKQEDSTVTPSANSSKRRRSEATLAPARCVCIIVSGLPGSGKTTLCRMLQEVLGGAWLDHDDFASKHSGKNLKQVEAITFQAMLAKSLSRPAHDQTGRLLFVDRASTLRSERGDLMQELLRAQWQRRGGKILFVELGHTSDAYGHGDDCQIAKRFSAEHVSLCISRIEARGAAHHKLRPSPNLRSIVKGIAKAAEPLHPDELAEFDGQVSIEVSRNPVEQSMTLLEELHKLRWLDGLKDAAELETEFEAAWQASQRKETHWRTSAAAADTVVDLEQPQDEWLLQCQKALEVDQARERARAEAKALAEEQAVAGETEVVQVEEELVPLYWKIDLPEVSQVLAQRGILPAGIQAVEHPHTTLLYLGGHGDDARAAQQSNISEEQFAGMREVLEGLAGEEFEVQMVEIVIEENIVCAVVSLPPIVPSVNKVPHITLGTKPGVPARYANEVLEEVKDGRTEGITSIKLPAPRLMRGRLMLHYANYSTASRAVGGRSYV